MMPEHLYKWDRQICGGVFAVAVFGGNTAFEYWIDAWQRSVLVFDVLRQRGNNSAEHNARKSPECAEL